jgi:uncharacterized protein (TIGR00299 family) protein
MKDARVLYLDAFSGVSGDMFLSAILDCGYRLEDLVGEISKLGVRGYRLSKKAVRRNGIRATLLDIDVSKVPRFPGLRDMERLIGKSALEENVKSKALAVLSCLAAAEAKVHGTTKSRVHFHELGNFDTILDIVGTVAGLGRLGVEKVYSSPLPLGRGRLASDHGLLAAPAPATVEILKGSPVKITERQGELTTPTGAALVRTLAEGFTEVIHMTVEKIGYGAGTRVTPGIPNLLRAFLGSPSPAAWSERVYVIETNIDDMDPQVYPYLFGKLQRAGAHDVYCTPVQMKKGRPGILLTVISGEEVLDSLTGLLLRETTTIGLRYWEVKRRISERRMKKVKTSLGEVRVKEVDLPSSGRRGKIEFEDLARLAEKTGKSVVDLERELQRELDLTRETGARIFHQEKAGDKRWRGKRK